MTKVISFQIPKSQREFVRYQEDRGRHFYDKLHQHPQLQMTVILEGKGQFLSGDYVGRFQAGDVFFLGKNAPHVFRSDVEYFGGAEGIKSAGNTVFFDFDALGKALGELEELQTLQRFESFSGFCFQVFGHSKNCILELFKAFPNSSKLVQFQLAIQLLSIMEESGQDLVSLNRRLVLRGLSERDGKRMDQVIQFLLENRFRQIKLDEVAAEAHLSKEAFCRFFKLRTRTTFTRYLLQLRINEARKLLKETDLGISEIAYTVGFENLSYFNRAFKGIVGTSPRAFRKQVL